MHNVLLTLYMELLPALLQVTGVILGVLLMRAANIARTRWGIEIEARHREALHSAIMSGVQAALARGLTGQAVIQAARVHAQDSVPDAIRGLPQATERVLASIAEAKQREVIAQGFPLFSAEITDEVVPEVRR